MGPPSQPARVLGWGYFYLFSFFLVGPNFSIHNIPPLPISNGRRGGTLGWSPGMGQGDTNRSPRSLWEGYMGLRWEFSIAREGHRNSFSLLGGGYLGTESRRSMVYGIFVQFSLINEFIRHGLCPLSLIHMAENEHQLYGLVGFGSDCHVRRTQRTYTNKYVGVACICVCMCACCLSTPLVRGGGTWAVKAHTTSAILRMAQRVLGLH